MKNKILWVFVLLAAINIVSAASCNTNSDCKALGPGFECNSGTCEWAPPIGIPKPSFGIEETYRMYDNPANRNPALTYHQNAEGGYFTHYVDNSNPSCYACSNTLFGGNAQYNCGSNYGSLAVPLCNVPGNLPEGSVVEINPNTHYHLTGPSSPRDFVINSTGTANRPVFIRGSSSSNLPTFDFYSFSPTGSYYIVENINVTEGNMAPLGQYYSIRNSVQEDSPGPAPGLNLGGEHGVFYNSEVSKNRRNVNELHGIHVSTGTNYTWILDNNIYYNSGDSLQACHHCNPSPDYIYIGRNTLYSNRENAIDIKNARNVIVSQNKMYDHRAAPAETEFCYPDGFCMTYSSLSAGSDGASLVVNERGEYPKENIWILFNTIYDTDMAIRAQDSVYIIGNLMYDLHGTDTTHSSTSYWYGGYCIQSRDGNFSYIVSNTCYSARVGVSNPRALYGDYSVFYVADNIFQSMDNYYISSGVASDIITGGGNLLYPDIAAEGYYFPSSMSSRLSSDILDSDPLFLDLANRNFTLSSGSPAIDAGIVSDVYQKFYNLYGIDIKKDIEGKLRPQGSGWDIGAYEYSGSSSCVNGDTKNCPLQLGVCAGSMQTCSSIWPGCSSTNYLSNNANYEITESSCSDGLDNDCDGLTDCADSDCSALPVCSPATCQDSIQNQDETGVDCGGVCKSGIESNCADGIDNDNDCLIDCADSDCSAGCASCSISSTNFSNFKIPSQTGTFSVEFDATPLSNNIDGLVTLSKDAGNTFSDYAVLVLFDVSGNILVRNASGYRADTQVPYHAGTTYHIKVDVDVGAKTYDVIVDKILIADDYNFRTEQLSVSSLDNWGIRSDGANFQVCNFQLSGCTNEFDTDCSGSVCTEEMGIALNNWNNNQITIAQMGQALDLWKNSGC